VENLTYLDFLVLVKIDQNSVIERFGPAINTSFFETANLLGTLKVKGFVDLETSIGGMSRISLTETGRQAIEFCNKGTLEPLDSLDNAVLAGVGRGYVSLDRLTEFLNVKPSDLAVHLNKLSVQGFLEPSIKSAKVSLVLTEKGFNTIGKPKAEGFAVPGQTKLTDSSQPGEGKAEEAASPKQQQKQGIMPDPLEIAQDAKDILFGMIPKGSKQPKPEPKQPEPQPAAPLSKKEGTISEGGVKGEIKPPQEKPVEPAGQAQTQPVPEKANIPAYPYAPRPDAQETGAGTGPKQAQGAMPEHHATEQDIRATRLLSKLEYYASRFVGYAIVLLALIAGAAIAYFIFVLLGFKLF